MGFKHMDFTLVGAAANRLTTTHIPVRQVTIFNLTGNAALSIGGPSLAAASYGTQIAPGTSFTLGPFSGELPVSLDSLYLLGTAGNVIHVAYVT